MFSEIYSVYKKLASLIWENQLENLFSQSGFLLYQFD